MPLMLRTLIEDRRRKPKLASALLDASWRALPTKLTISELEFVGHAANGNEVAEQHLEESSDEVLRRLEQNARASGTWSGSPVELFVALFVKARSIRGFWELPAEDDPWHVEALALYRAWRDAMIANPDAIRFVQMPAPG